MLAAELHYVDYIVFVILTLLSLAAGSFYAYKERRNVSPSRYHLGNRQLKVLPVALSMMVTFESSIAYLGYPAEVYIHGFIYWWFNVGLALGYSSLLWISIPLFHPLKLTSVYEYFQLRYNSLMVRRLASQLGTLSMVLYIGIVLHGASIAVASMTGIPAWVSIIVMVTLAAIYTSLGGIKAVVVTDVVQTVVMVISLFVVIIYGTVKSGGISIVIAYNKPSGRLQLFDFDPNPLTRHTFWTLVVGGFFRFISIAFNQAAVQRINSVGTRAEARKVVYIAVSLMVCLQLLVQIEGLVAYAYFSSKGCDPLAAGLITNPNQIIPFTVMDMFHTLPGLSGLFLASLISATLSTVSSMMGSISAVVSEDLVKPNWKNMNDAQLTKVAKVVVVIFAVVSVLIGLFIGIIKGPINQITGSVKGAVDTFIGGMFILSIFMKFVTRKGVIAGGLSGLVIALWLSSGYNFSPGRKHTPWLPAGPTDQCWNTTYTNTYDHYANGSVTYDLKRSTNLSESSNSKYISNENNVHGIDYLYSISYIYFASIVLAVTIVVGVIVSKLTTPIDCPEPHLILSFPKCPFNFKKHDSLKASKDRQYTQDESTDNMMEIQPLKHEC